MLRWDFERRRPYLSYEVLAPTARAIAGFLEENGPQYGSDQYQSLRELLQDSTGRDWAPDQGEYKNIFRNYKRLLRGFEIATVEDNRLILLETGQWIADNEPEAIDFYWRLIDRFRYPNPAFESFEEWQASGRIVSPFRIIVRCLTALEVAERGAFLTPQEILSALYNANDDLEDKVLVNAILAYRKNRPAPTQLLRFTSDGRDINEDARQVREIASFLIQAGVLNSSTLKSIRMNTRLTLARQYSASRPRIMPSVSVSRDFEALEGSIYNENRRLRKRNAQVRDQAIHQYGLVCPSCGIDFSKYGDLGRAAIDVHHLRPIAERLGNEVTTLRDVRVLCANCHRMVHAGGQLRTPEELRTILLSVKSED